MERPETPAVEARSSPTHMGTRRDRADRNRAHPDFSYRVIIMPASDYYVKLPSRVESQPREEQGPSYMSPAKEFRPRPLSVSDDRNTQIVLTLSLQRVINFEFPGQPHQKYNITQ